MRHAAAPLLAVALSIGGCFAEETRIAPTDASTTSTASSGSSSTALPQTDTSSASTSPDATTTTGVATGTTAEADSSTGCVPACGDSVCGIEPACRTSCGECDPPDANGIMIGCVDKAAAYCGVRLGFAPMFPTASTIAGEILLGYRVVLDQPRDLRGLGFIADGSSGNDLLRMALYAAQPGGGPTDLLREVAATTASNGYNDYPVAELMLPAGDYFVMIHTSVNTASFRTPTAEH
ncbi:MAG: hypothetical protein K0V04_31555, partial [Deltaproteobacteria bacterium]|nr:hypothetical protein [Deltaproteobacteria bacterium]